MYLSICFFIVLSWLLGRVERGKMKLLLLRYIIVDVSLRVVGNHMPPPA
jgi:hypothetical protein